MDFGKWALQMAFVLFVLIVLAAAGALTFPGISSLGAVASTPPANLFFLLLSIIVLTLMAFALGRGIKSIKSTFEGVLLAFASSIMIGGILSLLAVFKFPYSIQMNLTWLGPNWYDPWIAAFLVGAPILLVYVM